MKYLVSVALAALFVSAPVSASIKLDVTVTSEAGAAFSAPIWTYRNLSTIPVQISSVGLSGGAPWDFVYIGPAGSAYEILDPAGGTRLITEGEERTTDGNNGCTAGITHSLTSFDPGDSFRYSTDPEAPGCGSAVVDIRPALNADAITISALFSNGLTLTGSDWVLEIIDPSMSASLDSNQRYRLTLEVADPVPEAATWGMMLAGFGMVGTAMRRRRAAVSFG